MELLIKYWKPVAILASIVAIFGTGYYKGYQHEKLKFDTHLAEDARLVAVAKAENDRRVSEAQSVTSEVTKEYANAVSKINDYYKSHPRIVRMCDNSGANTLSASSQDSAGATQAASGVTKAVTPAIDLNIASDEIKQCQALISLELGLDSIK